MYECLVSGESGVAGKLSSHCRPSRLRNFLAKLSSPSCATLESKGAQPLSHPQLATLVEAILQALHVVGLRARRRHKTAKLRETRTESQMHQTAEKGKVEGEGIWLLQAWVLRRSGLPGA